MKLSSLFKIKKSKNSFDSDLKKILLDVELNLFSELDKEAYCWYKSTNVKKYECFILSKFLISYSLSIAYKELDSNIDDLFVIVGPCIRKENYEVKINFYEKFTNQNPQYEDFFKKISDGKYIFDLRGFINKKISDLNIQNIENIKMDTFTAQETFYSHRRSLFNNEKDYGRCISVILMT